MDLNSWAIESLYLVPSEDSLDDEGRSIHCVFNREIDAVTWVDSEEVSLLKQRGIRALEALPD